MADLTPYIHRSGFVQLEAPDAPTLLVTVNAGVAYLEWTDVGADYYGVFQGTDSGMAGLASPLTTIYGNSTSVALTTGLGYYFVVKGYIAQAGYGLPSNEVFAGDALFSTNILQLTEYAVNLHMASIGAPLQ